MSKMIFLLAMISSLMVSFADEKFIGVIDIVPGVLSNGEPALILGENGILVAQVMSDDYFKRLDMFGKVKQIGDFSVLSSDGTIYLWQGEYIAYAEPHHLN